MLDQAVHFGLFAFTFAASCLIALRARDGGALAPERIAALVPETLFLEALCLVAVVMAGAAFLRMKEAAVNLFGTTLLLLFLLLGMYGFPGHELEMILSIGMNGAALYFCWTLLKEEG
jgi:hypothetical protein